MTAVMSEMSMLKQHNMEPVQTLPINDTQSTNYFNQPLNVEL
jgi:hypothetical protein